MKILIVDDDELNRKILKEILEDGEFESVEACDGLEAFDMLKKESDIGLILLDRRMPNMDGMQFMEEMRNRPEYKDIPVIMQTAANSPREVIEGSSTGVYYYLTKPYDEQIVISIVRAALEKREL